MFYATDYKIKTIEQTIVLDVDHEETMIASIPISCFKRKDRFFWKHSVSGSYTIKSSYMLAREEAEQ